MMIMIRVGHVLHGAARTHVERRGRPNGGLGTPEVRRAPMPTSTRADPSDQEETEVSL